MLPSSSRHGPPLLNRVRVPTVPRRHRSYSALRLPHPRRPLLWACPSSHGLPGRGRLFCAVPSSTVVPAMRAPAFAHGASGILALAPRRASVSTGEMSVSQVTGPSSSTVPRSKTPPSAPPPSAHSRRRRCCLQGLGASRHSVPYVFRGNPSAARSLAYLRIAASVTGGTPAQGSLPACRAQLWPGGFRTRRTTPQRFMKSTYFTPL